MARSCILHGIARRPSSCWGGCQGTLDVAQDAAGKPQPRQTCANQRGADPRRHIGRCRAAEGGAAANSDAARDAHDGGRPAPRRGGGSAAGPAEGGPRCGGQGRVRLRQRQQELLAKICVVRPARLVVAQVCGVINVLVEQQGRRDVADGILCMKAAPRVASEGRLACSKQ
jgi:hypothetical protein